VRTENRERGSPATGREVCEGVTITEETDGTWYVVCCGSRYGPYGNEEEAETAARVMCEDT
jgi:hypothetical protein